MPVRMTPFNRFQPWVPAGCLIILAAFILACAGGKGGSDSVYAEADLSGRTLLIPAIDTSVVAIDPIGDVVDGLPSNGRVFAPQALLAGRFRDHLTESLRYHLRGPGLRIEQADSLFDTTATSDSLRPPSSAAQDSTPPAPADKPRPDFILKFTSLESRRKTATELMPKIGIINRFPLHLSGEYLLWDVARGSEAARGRFRTYVTGARGIAPDTWEKAFDDAARQVAKAMPFGMR